MNLSPSERALIMAALADLAMAGPIIGLGFMSGSASGSSEAIRAIMLYAIDIFSIGMLLAINRRKFSQFEFGVEKLQILVQTVIVFGMGLSAIFIGWRILLNLTSGGEIPNYIFCLLFAAFSYVNVMVNFWCLRAMVREERLKPSIIMRGQIKNRAIMLASSVAVTISTAAVVVPDPTLFNLIDTAGALVVFCVILYTMVNMLKSGVLTLLDAPIDEQDKLLVIREIVDHFHHWSSIAFIRTRRLGYSKYVEIGLCFDDATTMKDALDICGAIQDGIRQKVDNAFVAVFPADQGEPGSLEALLPAGNG